MRRITAIAAFALLCALVGSIGGAQQLSPTVSGFFETFWAATGRPHTQVVLSSKLDENMVSVAVEEGQPVKEGDELILFDTRVIRTRIAIAQTEADFAVRIRSVQTKCEYVANECQRLQGLYEAGAGSETGESDRFISDVELKRARYERDMAELERDDLDRSKTLAGRWLDFYNAREHDYVVKSPIDGVVSHVWVEAGEMARVGQQLIEVIDPDVVEVTVYLLEQHAMDVACGQQAMVRFTAVGNREFPGTVSVVLPYVDSSSRKFTVKVLVEPGVREVKPGMECQVRFVRP